MESSQRDSQVMVIQQRLQTARAQCFDLIDTQLQGRDPNRLYRSPDGQEWTIMENLAHIREMLPYWANEIDQLLARPGQNFGRTKEHAGRIQGIAEHRADDLTAIRGDLIASFDRITATLARLQESDLALQGVHTKFGEQRLDWFIAEFVTDHLDNHLEQMQAAMAIVDSASSF